MEIKVRFKGNDPQLAAFYPTLRKRVDAWFQEQGRSKHANFEMLSKTVILLAMYIVPYLLMMTGVITAGWAMLLSCVVMGVGVAGIGMSIMHDANHGAYSGSQRINTLVGYTLNLVGGHVFNWKVQHNVLHHTYTNVEGLDEDVRERLILRFSPYTRLMKIHRFQHIYAFFLYGLMTISWSIGAKDIVQAIKYGKAGMDKMLRTDMRKEVTVMILTKLVYITYMIVLPLLLLDISFWQWFLGFFLMHWVAGFILGVVFQLAHVVEKTAHHENPGENGTIENAWAVHEMETTANFAPDNRVINWYVGGLNYQIEHHLFTSICHVHYRHIAPIVKQTAEEFGVPYHQYPSFGTALLSHVRTLRSLGQPEPVSELVPA